mmetsp:Transcript_66408/g.151997  ORF Transcript_66408/g.151997 Transcript_66408/m.151997 type:complete len:1592 (-) Transcript_66408:147-4922(-)
MAASPLASDFRADLRFGVHATKENVFSGMPLFEIPEKLGVPIRKPGSGKMMLKVSIEAGLPKLLLKLCREDADAVGAKNLSEVNVQGTGRRKVAVVSVAEATPRGSVHMAQALATLLGCNVGTYVEVELVGDSSDGTGTTRIPLSGLRPTAQQADFPNLGDPTTAGAGGSPLGGVPSPSLRGPRLSAAQGPGAARREDYARTGQEADSRWRPRSHTADELPEAYMPPPRTRDPPAYAEVGRGDTRPRQEDYASVDASRARVQGYIRRHTVGNVDQNEDPHRYPTDPSNPYPHVGRARGEAPRTRPTPRGGAAPGDGHDDGDTRADSGVHDLRRQVEYYRQRCEEHRRRQDDYRTGQFQEDRVPGGQSRWSEDRGAGLGQHQEERSTGLGRRSEDRGPGQHQEERSSGLGRRHEGSGAEASQRQPPRPEPRFSVGEDVQMDPRDRLNEARQRRAEAREERRSQAAAGPAVPPAPGSAAEACATSLFELANKRQQLMQHMASLNAEKAARAGANLRAQAERAGGDAGAGDCPSDRDPRPRGLPTAFAVRTKPGLAEGRGGTSRPVFRPPPREPEQRPQSSSDAQPERHGLSGLWRAPVSPAQESPLGLKLRLDPTATYIDPEVVDDVDSLATDEETSEVSTQKPWQSAFVSALQRRINSLWDSDSEADGPPKRGFVGPPCDDGLGDLHSDGSGSSSDLFSSSDPETHTEHHRPRVTEEDRPRPPAPAAAAPAPTAAAPPRKDVPVTRVVVHSDEPQTAASRRASATAQVPAYILRRRKTEDDVVPTLGSIWPGKLATAVGDAEPAAALNLMSGAEVQGSYPLERTDFGEHVTRGIRMWLEGEASTRHVAQLVADRAVTAFSNLKGKPTQTLLGGALGAVIGGWVNSDWFIKHVFQYGPERTLGAAYSAIGMDSLAMHASNDEVSLAYRKECLRLHPHRGGDPESYLRLNVLMEVIRAQRGEGTASSSDAASKVLHPAASMATLFGAPPVGDGRREESSASGPSMTSDELVAKELGLTEQDLSSTTKEMSMEELSRINKFFDDYILRMMRFKSEVMDEIARLHEQSAYVILGVSSNATDGEIRKAYRKAAMMVHPDKGGDAKDFQELANAYEKIMEQREGKSKTKGDDDMPKPPSQAKPADEAKPSKGGTDEDKSEASEEDDAEAKTKKEEDGEEPSPDDDTIEGLKGLAEKAQKAAGEAARFASTAADFATQAAEAAKTCQRAALAPTASFTLLKSIAHSAVVLTLTVVKAVRVVGYAALDAASVALSASKQCASSPGCAAAAAAAMSAGFESLNAASECAQKTEVAASELQKAATQEHEADQAELFERLAKAANDAAAAASAAAGQTINAAMKAAEAAKQTKLVVDAATEAADAKKAEQAEGEEKKTDEDKEDKEASQEGDEEPKEPKAPEMPPPEDVKPPSQEDRRARFESQRVNNRKLLARLNAEITNLQTNVKLLLNRNCLLIPEVSLEEKTQVLALLRDYMTSAKQHAAMTFVGLTGDELRDAILRLPVFAPVCGPARVVAVSCCVSGRVLKLAALLDVEATVEVVTVEFFDQLRLRLQGVDAGAHLDKTKDLVVEAIREIIQVPDEE